MTSCPGYETSPNLCTCPCEGCKHHCSAHRRVVLTDLVGPREERVWTFVTNLSALLFMFTGGVFGSTSQLASQDRVLYWLMSLAGILLGLIAFMPVIAAVMHIRKRQLLRRRS